MTLPLANHPGDGEDGLVHLGPGVAVPRTALRFSFVASSGPGGQNVNKRSTRAQLRVTLDDIPLSPAARARLERLAGPSRLASGELLISDGRRRSQRQNLDSCVERLRALVLAALPDPTPRRPTRPTRGSVRRRLDEKTHRGEVKRLRNRPHGE